METTSADSERHPKARPDVVSATHEKLTVLLDLENAQYYQLNSIAARVWALVCDELPVSDIVADLASHYEAPLSTIRTDVDRLLESMRDAGLVVW